MRSHMEPCSCDDSIAASGIADTAFAFYYIYDQKSQKIAAMKRVAVIVSSTFTKAAELSENNFSDSQIKFIFHSIVRQNNLL